MASGLKLITALLILMVVAAPLTTDAAVTCAQVTGAVGQCIGYLRGSVPSPSSQCCGGVKSLNAAARTTPDRQAACNCLQTAARSISGINLNLAAGLPGKCGVNIPYKISPSTNCKTVK